MQDNKVVLNLEIDLEDIKQAIEKSGDLNDNHELFKRLAEVQRAKKVLGEAEDVVKSLEAEVKATINSKAKNLYGENWKAIAGNGYKISRSGTGSTYEITGDVEEKFIAVKVSVDSKAVETFIKENNTLPEGIAYNQQRGESIRITVQDNEPTEDSQTQP